MNKNYLKGTNGDRINAYLSISGANLRKLLTAFFLPFFIFDRIIKKFVKYFQITVNTKSQIHCLEALNRLFHGYLNKLIGEKR